MTPFSTLGLPFPGWPPSLSWPFPFPVPIELARRGPINLEQSDLDTIKAAGVELEQALHRFRRTIGSVNARYGIGPKVALVGIIAEAAFHDARSTAFARGYWP